MISKRKQYQQRQDQEDATPDPGSEGGASELTALLEEERGGDSPAPAPGIDSDGSYKRERNRPEHDSMDNERDRSVA